MTVIQPAEWDRHDAVWVAFPFHEALWEDLLPAAQAEHAAMCRAIAHGMDPERLEVLVFDATHERAARKALDGLNARFHPIRFGDIWLRDTAPIFVRDATGDGIAACFKFNGWGDKYMLEHDGQVSGAIGRASGCQVRSADFVLEGGAIDTDGNGTFLTTESCLLNPNRGPVQDKPTIARRLQQTLGARHVVWIRDGLLNDHTDGHVDTVARFIDHATVVCMHPSGDDDPNRDVLLEIADTLRAARDADGRPLTVHTIPSPGLVLDEDGEPMPASHVNFYIANHSVVVPTYGTPFDTQVVHALQALMPSRTVIGCAARAILEGGGAFHCITQQQPALSAVSTMPPGSAA